MTPVAQLTITVLQDAAGKRSVNINGPIADKVFCYGLLVEAILEIHQFDPSKASGLIVPVNGNRMPLP